MSSLSNRTKEIVHHLFEPKEAKKVCDILESECSPKVLGMEGWNPIQMERVWFAIIKVVNEGVFDFDAALKLTKTDWRDLFMVAGFAEELDAHIKWASAIGN